MPVWRIIFRVWSRPNRIIGILLYQYNHMDVRPIPARIGAETFYIDSTSDKMDKEFVKRRIAFGIDPTRVELRATQLTFTGREN